MFSLGTPQELDLLQTTILDVIRNYEPRAQAPTAEVDASDLGSNAVTVTVSYKPVNLPGRVSFSFPLSRVR
jgi:hypothetical protein